MKCVFSFFNRWYLRWKNLLAKLIQKKEDIYKSKKMIKVCLRIFSIWFKLFLLSLTFFTQSHALLARISIFVSARDKLRAQDNQKMTRNWKKVENLKFRDTFLSIFALKILFCFSFQCFFFIIFINFLASSSFLK